MRCLVLCLSLVLLTPPVAAQDVTYWQVSGVADDDVLNIRTAPRADAPIIGSLAPDAGPVEIIEIRDGWAGTPSDAAETGLAWMSAAYLTRIELEEWTAGLPAGLVCSGTEPFWGLEQSGSALRLDAFWREPEMQSLAVTSTGRAHGIGWPVVIELDEGEASAIFSPQTCSDGMSDTRYGWQSTLILRGEMPDGGPLVLEGCCRMRLPE